MSWLALVLVATFALGSGQPSSARPPIVGSLGVGDMTAMFAKPSYPQGRTAQLHIVTDAHQLSLQPLSAVPTSTSSGSIFHDRAVGPVRRVRWRPGAGTVGVPIGRWPSGLYFVRVRSTQGEVLAPVIVRSPRLGQTDVAVVVPTFTWQAYNRRFGDSWYVCSCVHTVDLSRPYLDSGVPYNFNQYDRRFFAWIVHNNERVDVLSDQDFNRIASGAAIRRLYRMVVFEGHGEYVTGHMLDITEQYRDRGGHLAFLSANQFFRDVVISGNSMTLIGRWRDRGRPEAALIGSQYLDWYRNRYHSRPYTVVGQRKLPWLFARTGLRNGSKIGGHYGVEIDAIAESSPPRTIVAAAIPNIFPGETAQMTYYTTRAGAEVFNAGTINFGGAAQKRAVAQILRNLWAHMAPGARRRQRPTRP